jgi:hypothetical protein
MHEATAISPALRRGWLAWAALGLVLLIATGIRLRLLDFPLERDEGEYAYAGQLLLQGIPPYVLAYNMKWPGVYAAYAAIMAVFGESIAGIHVGLILVTLATAILTFLLARRICGEAGAVVAAGTYALLAITPATLGIAAHATHFVILPALAGVLLLRDLDEATRLRRILAAGLLIGLAVIAKQAGAAFGLFAAGWVVWQEFRGGAKDWRRLAARLGTLAAGGLLPFVLTCLLLMWAGVFDRFWHWTIEYAAAYASIIGPVIGMQVLWATVTQLFTDAPGLWLLGLLGLGLIWFSPALKSWRVFVLGFAAFSFLAVCPGWYFRGHYFLLLLPAFGLLAGIAVQTLTELLPRGGLLLTVPIVAATLFGLAGLQSLWVSRKVYFQFTPIRANREIYGGNPFPESIEVAKFIDQHCLSGSKIAVIGSEPQIYFYSRRHSATGYIYAYPLMEPQPYAAKMQEEMIQEIEQANPRYIVFVSVSTSWLQRPESHRRIFDWFNQLQGKLRLAGVAEILSLDESAYHWSLGGATFTPRAANWIAVFENPAGH